jgi:hypothetical protein
MREEIEEQIADKDVTSFRNFASYHPCTSKLIAVLKGGAPGDEKTDDELSGVCGLSTEVGGLGYHYLLSAMRFADRQGVQWQRVRGAGTIKCLTGIERMDTADRDRRHVVKVATRTVRRLSGVNRDELPEPEKRRLDVTRAQLSAVALFGRQSTTKKIENKLSGEVDRQKVIELFQ